MDYTQIEDILHNDLDDKYGSDNINDLIKKHNILQSHSNFILKCNELHPSKEYLKVTLKMSFLHFLRSYQGPDYEMNCIFIETLSKLYYNSVYPNN